MSSFLCRFCAHGNPAGAKFCNECGSPLHLKPCPRCDAITESSAGECHQCGTPFVEDAAIAEHARGVERGSASNPAAIANGAKRASENVPIALAERVDAASRGAAPSQPAIDDGSARSDGGELDEAREQLSMARPTAAIPIDALAPRSSLPHAQAHGEANVAARRRAVRSRASAAPPEMGTPKTTARYVTLTVLALCAVTAGAYYAYRSGLLAIVLTSRGSAAQSASIDRTTPTSRAVESKVPQSRASSTDSSPPSVANGAQSASAPAHAPSVANAVQSTGVASKTDGESSMPMPIPSDANRTDSPTNGAAPASDRLRKKLSTAATPADGSNLEAKRSHGRNTNRAAPAASPRSRDAAATQRLIERDLAGFPPPAKMPEQPASPSRPGQ